MRILDLLRKGTPSFKKQRELLLDEAGTQHWPQLLVEHSGLDREFKEFTRTLAELDEDTRKGLAKFTDEETLSAIPDRARTINAIHGKEYATQVEKLLKTASFTDLFTFEERQAHYFEASSAFTEMSAKHVSVLKEFMHDELKSTQESLQQLEDAIIAFMKTLEERKFPAIRKLYDVNKKRMSLAERQEKYVKLLASLRNDLKRTSEKRKQIEEDIREQRSLIRNEVALTSLAKMQQLEEELFHLAAQYNVLAKDLHILYNKHPDLEMAPEVKKVITELQKDHSNFLINNAETIKRAFESMTQQLEEENLGNRNLIERLTRLAGSSEADARRISTATPDLRSLKRDVMKDIAALQIYDKQQFLMRAQAEENAIGMKIAYLEQELDPNKRLAMEREMKDIAKSLGAIVKGKEPQTKPAETAEPSEPEQPDIEPEHEDAALDHRTS